MARDSKTKRTSRVKEVSVILNQYNGDLCRGTLPLREEEPRVLSYAAAERILDLDTR